MLSVLYTLLLVAVFLGSSLDMAGPAGVYLVVAFGPLPLMFLTTRRLLWGCLVYGVLLFLFVILTALALEGTVRSVAFQMQCRNNLKQIAFALANYQEEYNCYPPVFVADENGRPMHSWRVLILPYLEQKPLYDAYDFNEPWDGPNNKKLHDIRLSVFACPSDFENYRSGPAMTNYVAVYGPGTAWSKLSRPSDTYSNTKASGDSIVLVEVADAGIQWIEPVDLNVEELGSADSLKASSKHMRGNGLFYDQSWAGAHVTLDDVRVKFIPSESLSPEGQKKLLVLGGCTDENIESVSSAIIPRFHWRRTVGLGCWLVSLILLCHWAARCRRSGSRVLAGGEGCEVASGGVKGEEG